jgi:hypothetical protein
VLAPRGEAFEAVWRARGEPCDPARLEAMLRELLEVAALELLDRLYPGALDTGS